MWGDEADVDTRPRGKVDKGYAGGEMRLPRIDPHVHLPEQAQGAIGLALRTQDEAGASIRQLAEQTTYSIGRVRSLLQHAGTTLRNSPTDRGQTPAPTQNHQSLVTGLKDVQAQMHTIVAAPVNVTMLPRRS